MPAAHAQRILILAADCPSSTPEVPAPMAADADRNLLLGILAHQLDFVGRDALIAALNAWIMRKGTPLGALLVERGDLAASRRQLLDALVDEHIRAHGGDPARSLQALSSVGPIAHDLAGMEDADLQSSIGLLPVPATLSGLPPGSSIPPSADPFATRRPESLGLPTSWNGRFRVVRPHAQGGLGIVSVALDDELDREVAFKEIKPDHADHRGSRARFVLEAEITGKLEHPGIIPIYGLGSAPDGRPFYAMRFIRGDSLADAINRYHDPEGPYRDPAKRSLQLRELLGRFLDVCDALAYAHSRGVLHRDLKPGNVMLGPFGETLVVDWGLALPLERVPEGHESTQGAVISTKADSGSLPRERGAAIGTPAYMPPEQAEGDLDRLGPRSDVYGLGAILYELLTGKRPVDGRSLEDLLGRIRRGEIKPPRQLRPEIPPALEAVCLKALALRPEDRYPTPRTLAADLKAWLADEPVTARREPLGERCMRWARHHKPLVTGSIIVSLLVPAALAAIFAIWNQRNLAEREKIIQQYYNLIEPPPEAARGPGWTWDRFSSLTVAASLDVPQHVRDPARLRSEVAACLATTDVREASPSVRSLLDFEPRPFAARAIPDASCLAFSPDGRYMAFGQGKTTVSASFQVRVVDRQAGSARTLWVATGAGLIDMASARIRGESAGYEGARSIAFSPLGDTLVVGTRSGWLHLWDLTRTDPQPVSWRAHSATVNGLVFDPESRWLFTTSKDKTLKRWDLATVGPGKSPSAELRFDQDVMSPHMAPDGTWIACMADDQIQQFEVPSLRRLLARFRMGINRFTIAPDGRMVAAGLSSFGGGDQGTKVILIDLERNAVNRRLQDPDSAHGESHEFADLDLEFSPDGSILATASSNDRDRMIKLWEVASGRLLTKFPAIGSGFLDAAFTPDGQSLAVTTATGATLYELVGISFQRKLAHQGHPISAIGFDPQGRAMACASESRSLDGQSGDPDVTIWDAADAGGRIVRRVVPRQTDIEKCANVLILPGGLSLISSWASNRIVALPWVDGAPQSTLKVDASSQPVPIAFTAGEATLWAAVGDTVRAWSVNDWTPRPTWQNLAGRLVTGQISMRCLAAGRTKVAVGGRDGVVRIFDEGDVTNPRQQWTVGGGPLTQVAVSIDDRVIASGSQDGTLALYDIRGGREILRRKSHRNAIEAIAFSRDGRMLASGSKDRTVQIRSASDGFAAVCLTLPTATGPLIAVAFSPDGTSLYTVTRGETAVRLWDLKHLRERLRPMKLDWE